MKDGNFILSCRSGSRAPHAWLRENISTLDLFGDGFVLLRFGRNIDASSLVAAAAACRVPLKVVDIDDRDIAALYEHKLVLVRPDGHVAWRDALVPMMPAFLSIECAAPAARDMISETVSHCTVLPSTRQISPGPSFPKRGHCNGTVRS
jgi:hypothetical protein